jgi:hypothetical protein
MGFVTSAPLQRLLDLIEQKSPKIKIVTKPKSSEGTQWDPFECSSVDIAAIRSALSEMEITYLPEIYGWPGAGQELAKRLDPHRLDGLSEDTISIGCDCAPPNLSESGTNATGKTKYWMNICADLLQPADAYTRRSIISSLVFTELIKLAGGNLVDYAGLWAYFHSDRSQSPPRWIAPSRTTLQKMCQAGKSLAPSFPTYIAGTFMVWNYVVGSLSVGDQVTPTRPVLTLIPSPGTFGGGLGWQYPC